MQNQTKNISKFMSFVLRHKPEEIGLEINDHGWARVDELITKMNESGFSVNFEVLERVVQTNDKQRFAFNEEKTLIRASQGHSIEIELNMPAVKPPDILYHGTAEKYLESILRTGLQRQNRRHVHLSARIDTAKAVGSRHGKPIIFIIKAKEMHEAGFKFYLSENKVWLIDAVPVEYITR